MLSNTKQPQHSTGARARDTRGQPYLYTKGGGGSAETRTVEFNLPHRGGRGSEEEDCDQYSKHKKTKTFCQVVKFPPNLPADISAEISPKFNGQSSAKKSVNI